MFLPIVAKSFSVPAEAVEIGIFPGSAPAKNVDRKIIGSELGSEVGADENDANVVADADDLLIEDFDWKNDEIILKISMKRTK